MNRAAWGLLLLCVTGCWNSGPTVPTADAATEQRHAEATERAGAAERNGKMSAED